jgi:hypothetical protein
MAVQPQDVAEAPRTVPERPLPAPTADIAEGLANIAELGVTIHPGFLPVDLVGRLLERIDEQAALERERGLALVSGPVGIDQPLARAQDDVPPTYQAVRMLPNKGRIFIDLMMHPTSLAYVGGVLKNRPFNLWSMSALISRSGTPAQPPHIDQAVVPAEMCVIPAMVNVFLCLSDFDADMGATLLAPGTHALPRLRPEDRAGFQPAVAKAGDAIIWEGRVWHGGGPHSASRTRYAISAQYALAAIRQNDVYTSALHDRVYETLNEAELTMLGFRAESRGYSNRIGPRNEHDQRRNTNGDTPYIPELHR